MMQVTVRLSAALARAAGAPRWSVALEDGATVSALLERVCAEHPDLAQQLASTVAVTSGRTVDRSEPLSDGMEVAFLTPVSGGCF